MYTFFRKYLSSIRFDDTKVGKLLYKIINYKIFRKHRHECFFASQLYYGLQIILNFQYYLTLPFIDFRLTTPGVRC